MPQLPTTDRKKKHIAYFACLICLMACIGIGIQNATGTSLLIHSHWAIILGIASAAVNFLMNAELMYDFITRFIHTGDPEKLSYLYMAKHAGITFHLRSLLFLITSILFMISAFAVVHGATFLVILGMAASLLIGLMTVAQELEVCFAHHEGKLTANHNPPQEQEQDQAHLNTTISYRIASLLGYTICIGNVMAWMTLFAYGLAYAVPSLMPHLVISSPAYWLTVIGVIFFTLNGGYCEWFFYSKFLPKTLRKLMSSHDQQSPEILDTLKTTFSKHPKKMLVGLLCVLGNGAVNSIVFYTTSKLALHALFQGFIKLGWLSAIPQPHILIPICIVIALFGGVSSFLLGLSFLTDKDSKAFEYIFGKDTQVAPTTLQITEPTHSQTLLQNASIQLEQTKRHNHTSQPNFLHQPEILPSNTSSNSL